MGTLQFENGPAAHGNQTQAARLLDISREALRYKLKKFGLIHADLRAANLLVAEAQGTSEAAVTIVDFDDCGLSWYCYDLAASVSFLEHRPELEELVAGWLAGYHRIGRLDAADLAVLPSLVMLRRLQLLAWTASHADTAMARSVGADFGADTAVVAERYLGGRLLAGIN